MNHTIVILSDLQSHGPIDITVKNQKQRDICSSPTNEGMFSTLSDVTINCTTLKMVGANEIVCKSESHKTSVYVLCPGEQLASVIGRVDDLSFSRLS